MNRKLHRELIKEAIRYHFWHNWKVITKGAGCKPDEKTVTLKETPYGKLTAGLMRRRCMGCGKEEYIEIGGGYSKFDRHWTPKPTAEDTAEELFGIPPHSDSSDCECGCREQINEAKSE